MIIISIFEEYSISRQYPYTFKGLLKVKDNG